MPQEKKRKKMLKGYADSKGSLLQDKVFADYVMSWKKELLSLF